MTTMILVRHGQSEANQRGEFAGHLDVKLLETGIIQAEKTAEFISENYSVSKVYASDLNRAYVTGKIIAEKCSVEISTDKRLREVDAGNWQGMKLDEIGKKYPEAWEIWLDDIGNCHTDKESIKELGDRVCEALSEIAKENDGKTVVVATHATPIRVATCLFGGHTLDYMKNVPWTSNAAATEISFADGKWSVVNACMEEHLKDLKTTLIGKV